MYLFFTDFDQTFKNPNKLLENDVKSFQNFLKNNKCIIVSESTIDDILNYVRPYSFDVDIYSSSSGVLLEDNKIIYDLISYELINKINDEFKESIYTAYGDGEEFGYVFNYQERLQSLYPKRNKEDNDLLYYIIVIENKKLGSLLSFIEDLDLSTEIIANDKNRTMVRVKSTKLNKSTIVDYYKKKYPNAKTVGISDSVYDLKYIKKCDIKAAIKNADNELKSHADIISEFDYKNSGAIRLINNICNF